MAPLARRGAHFCLEVVLPQLLRLAGRVEHHVLHEDAHRSADEGGEEVHVDVVARAVQAPTERGVTPAQPWLPKKLSTWGLPGKGGPGERQP